MLRKLSFIEKYDSFTLLKKVFFKRRFWWYRTYILYLINFSIFSRSVSAFQVSLSIIYQLYDLILRLPILKHHLILPYFCLVDLLSNQNQSVWFIFIPYPNQVYDNNKKLFLSGDLCVLYNVMLWNISFPGWCFQCSIGCTKGNVW